MPEKKEKKITRKSKSIKKTTIRKNTIQKKKHDIKESNMRFKDKISITFFSFLIGIIIWFLLSIFSGSTNFWVTTLIGTFIALPIFYKFKKISTKCPNCKKDFQMTDTHTETISEYQKWETRSKTRKGVTYKESVPVDVREFWQYEECDSCGYETRSLRTSKKDA